MTDIVWLASYPKSGNTWFRVFLTNFLRNSDIPADINALDAGLNASGRNVFDSAIGAECSDLTPGEIDMFRADALRLTARDRDETLYLKVHDAYTLDLRSGPLFPADVSRGAIYIARNPLDVCISFAHHRAKSVDQTITEMACATSALCGESRRIQSQLRQPLLTWSGHVNSWLDQTAIPVHLMRYEDMLREPYEAFAAAIRFLALPEDESRIRRALEFSSFKQLKNQEETCGFREKPAKAESFFREGKAEGWRSKLTEYQVKRVLHEHAVTMRRLGYINTSETC